MATQVSSYTVSASNLINERALFRGNNDASAQIIGVSSWARDARKLVAVHSTHKRVLMLEGEPGTGKKFLARMIHNASNNGNAPFVSLKLAGSSHQLADSVLQELLSFQDECSNTMQAHGGGTIYIEAVDEDSLYRIPGLLMKRAVHDNNIRILIGRALTSDDRDWSSNGEQVNCERIRIPALRCRTEDVEPLVSYYVAKICEQMGKETRAIMPDAMNALRRYDWPRNISELKLLMTRLVSRTSPPSIVASMLPRYLTGGDDTRAGLPAQGVDLTGEVERYEVSLLCAALRQSHGKQKAAAQLLRIKPTTLFMKLKRYNIDAEEFK